jgi:DNA-binding response OmpR family regulator
MVGAYAELCGFQYRAALNGKRALDEVEKKTPSLVVLDLMLPDLDGFEICSRLKSAEATRDIPIIMLTALSGDQHRDRGRRCGAADYLTKPFDPDKLMEAMSRHALRNGNSTDGVQRIW